MTPARGWRGFAEELLALADKYPVLFAVPRLTDYEEFGAEVGTANERALHAYLVAEVLEDEAREAGVVAFDPTMGQD